MQLIHERTLVLSAFFHVHAAGKFTAYRYTSSNCGRTISFTFISSIAPLAVKCFLYFNQ